MAEDHFGLRIADPVTVYITPLGRMYFEADWSSNQITLGFHSSPAVDVWLYSVYFGICHEYGHLVWHGRSCHVTYDHSSSCVPLLPFDGIEPADFKTTAALDTAKLIDYVWPFALA